MSTTIKSYLDSLKKDWTLEDWLSWPPDLFALTSLLLKQTGTYICSVLPPGDEKWPDDYNWKEKINNAKEKWYEWILDEQKANQELPKTLEDFISLLSKNFESVTIEDIRSLITPELKIDLEPPKIAWEVCKAILECHALADEACAGFGTPSGTNWTRDNSQKAVHCIANMLLAHTGSLSRLPPHIVRVLPKLRTPSVGMTLRSLSHHLTVHQTEVEIIWRTMPWANIDENTINVLVVPWPYEIEPTWFCPSSYSTQRNSTERARYFNYTGSPDKFPASELMAMLKDAERSVHRVHMVVFPELALTKENLNELLDALASKKTRDQLPMILAGVRSPSDKLGRNTVVLSTFFAGKWYQMEQDKHHRWKIDETQIQQYNLGGVLASNKIWWEAIELSSRRLSVLAPNNWFTLCPLICEDLARLEPVSEIIRGVGPTLLIAILLDGPQLQDRWPGRYASVMADDPGCSVLTVSSLGITKRSLAPDGKCGARIIALWKDQVKGWKPIEIENDKQGVLLTIAAHWKEEFTADGRGDDGNAAIFVLQGINQIEAKRQTGTPKEFYVDAIDFRISEPYDLLEITLFSYFVDAVLTAPGDVVNSIRRWVLGEGSDGILQKFRPRDSLLLNIRLGVNKMLNEPQRDNFRPFLEWFCDLIQRIPRNPDEAKHNDALEFKSYEQIINCTSQILERVMEKSFIYDLEKGDPFKQLRNQLDLPTDIPPAKPKHRRVRVCIYSCLAILWAVHKRLSDQRRKGLLNSDGAALLSHIEDQLKKDYDKQWYKAIKLFRE